MTDYIHHTNDVIDVPAGELPRCWNNISGLCALPSQGASGIAYLKELGWLPVSEEEPDYDPETERLCDSTGADIGDPVTPGANRVIRTWSKETIPVSVPTVVSPRQARLALNASGLRASVETWVDSQDQDTKDGWEFAKDIYRDDPLIVAAAAALDLTEQQLDDLFTLAATF